METADTRSKSKRPPEEGKANAALVAFFAHELGISWKSIRIVSGQKARFKRVEIEGMKEAAIIRKLDGRD